MLTQERLKELLNYDPETGVFTWAATVGSRAKAGAIAGCDSGRVRRVVRVVRVIRVEGTLCLAHRLAWLWMTGAWPSEEIDHRDGDPSNNRWSNLRAANRRLNQENLRKPLVTNSCGFLGVTYTHSGKRIKRWRATIMVNRVQKHLGRFHTPEEAHAAYVTAKRELHEGCTL